jgi:hypothetical protein
MDDASAVNRNKAVLPADAALENAAEGRPEAMPSEASPEVLAAAAADPHLTEDQALALLGRRDLPREALEHLHKNKSLTRLPKVRMAIVMHPHTPRHVSLPVIRHLYAFELMHVALQISVPPDVRHAAEEAVVARLETVSAGERFTLARRSSGRVAAALLRDKEERVLNAALANPQMTEAWIVKALKAGSGTELLAPAVCRHQKWSYRNDVKAALVANQHTPFGRVVQFASELPLNTLRDLLRNARLTPNVKGCVRGALEKRLK